MSGAKIKIVTRGRTSINVVPNITLRKWGYIFGDIADQADLVNYIKDHIASISQTAAEWNTSDPILSAGQFGIESDTRIQKVGDGSTAWSRLENDYVLINNGKVRAVGAHGGSIAFSTENVFIEADVNDAGDHFIDVDTRWISLQHDTRVEIISPIMAFTGDITANGDLSVNDNLKIGSLSYNALNKLDVDGNISISTNGVNVLRILKEVGAAGYLGPGFYSQSDIGYGVANGGKHVFIGIDGNTEIARFTPEGKFHVINTVAGGAFQSSVPPIAGFDRNANEQVFAIVQNKNAGNRAESGFVAWGEEDGAPATNARYIRMSVLSSTYYDGETVGTLPPAGCGFISSGGNLPEGLVLYSDDGKMRFSTKLVRGIDMALTISPYSNDGAPVSGQWGKIGIHNETPNAFLDLPGANADAASLLINQSSAVPTGGYHANGAIWRDATDLYLVKDGTENIFLVTTAVNVVSPTAPNRTIPITFGGQTYYIHAKTTNN